MTNTADEDTVTTVDVFDVTAYCESLVPYEPAVEPPEFAFTPMSTYLLFSPRAYDDE